MAKESIPSGYDLGVILVGDLGVHADPLMLLAPTVTDKEQEAGNPNWTPKADPDYFYPPAEQILGYSALFCICDIKQLHGLFVSYMQVN